MKWWSERTVWCWKDEVLGISGFSFMVLMLVCNFGYMAHVYGVLGNMKTSWQKLVERNNPTCVWTLCWWSWVGKLWERRDFEVCVCGGGGTWIQCMGRRDLKIVPGKKGFGGVCVCVWRRDLKMVCREKGLGGVWMGKEGLKRCGKKGRRHL